MGVDCTTAAGPKGGRGQDKHRFVEAVLSLLRNRWRALPKACSQPVRRGLAAGQHHDAPQALPLLSNLTQAYLIADRGYNFNPLVAI